MRAALLLLFLLVYSGPLSVIRAASPLLSATPGPKRAILPDMVGLNGNVLSLDQPWADPRMIDAFRRSAVGLFRFPAGTIANTYDWDLGWLDPAVAVDDLIPWVRQIERGPANRRRYGLDDLAALHRQTGVNTAFVLNLLTKDLEHSLRGLRRARELGLPVRYIELGNELFFNLPLESRIFPTPEDYGRTAQHWITAIKAEFPEAKCGIVAGGRAGHPRSDRWTERALSHCPAADAIIVHTYTPSGLVGRVRRDTTAGTEGTIEGDPAVSPQERQAIELRRLATPEGFAAAMTTAYAAGRRAYDYPADDREIWMTEWNLRADHDAFRGTWANALFVACFYHAMLENPAVTMSHYHNIVGPTFGAIYRTTGELSHLHAASVETTPYALTAGGLATSFFGRVMTGRTSAQQLNFQEAPVLAANDVRLPSLLAWRFEGPGGTSAILVNLAAIQQIVSTGWLLPPQATFHQYAASPETYVSGPAAIPVSSGKIGDDLPLPPRSVTLLRWD